MKQVTFFLLAITCFYNQVVAQLNIGGTISDQEGAGIAGVNISVNNNTIVTATDSKGEFIFKDLAKGNYELVFSCLGYTDTLISVNIKDKNVAIDFILNPEYVIMDEVVVSATRAGINSPFAYINVDAENLSKNHSAYDMPYMLSLTPSVVTTSDAGNGVGYTGIRIRGTDATRINVTINGIPLNDAESHSVYWVDVPDISSSTNDIQIQRGVGTSTNGAGAFGGTINVQTNKLNRQPYGKMSVFAGSFNTYKGTASFGTGLLNNHFTIDGRISKITSDGFVDRAWSNLISGDLSVGYYAKKDYLRFNIIYGEEHTYQSWNGVPKVKLENDSAGIEQYIADNWYDDEDAVNLRNSDSRTYNFYLYDNQTDNYTQIHNQLFYDHRFSSRLDLNLAFNYTHGKGYYEEYKKEQSFSKYHFDPLIIGTDTITSTDLIRRLWLDNDLYVGTAALNYKNSLFDLTFGSTLNYYNGKHYGEVIWAQYASESEIRDHWYDGTGEKTDASAFIKTNFNITKNLNFLVDIQARGILYEIDGTDKNNRDITQNHYYFFVNPKAGLFYDLNNNNKLFLSYAMAHREPSRSNFTDSDPAWPAPKPETLHDVEFGHLFNSKIVGLNTNLYYMRYADQLVVTGSMNDVGDYIMTNVKSSYRAGIEIAVNSNFSEKIRIEFNTTLSSNKAIDFTEYIKNYDDWTDSISIHGNTDLAMSPSVIAGGQIVWMPVKFLNLRWTSKYVGKQFIDNTMNDDRTLDPYWVNDLQANLTFSTKTVKEIGIMLKVNNIFNAQYENNAWVYRYTYGGAEYTADGYFPQAGTNFLAGLSINF